MNKVDGYLLRDHSAGKSGIFNLGGDLHRQQHWKGKDLDPNGESGFEQVKIIGALLL